MFSNFDKLLERPAPGKTGGHRCALLAVCGLPLPAFAVFAFGISAQPALAQSAEIMRNGGSNLSRPLIAQNSRRPTQPRPDSAAELVVPKGVRSAPITRDSASQLKVKLLASVRGNAYQIGSTADGHTVTIMPVGVDRGVILFDIDTGVEVARCTANYSSYAVSGNGRIVAGAVGGEVQLCDPLSPNAIRSLPRVAGDVTSLAFCSTGRFLAAGTSDGSVRVWDVTKVEPIWTSPPQSAPVTKIALSVEGKECYRSSENVVF